MYDANVARHPQQLTVGTVYGSDTWGNQSGPSMHAPSLHSSTPSMHGAPSFMHQTPPMHGQPSMQSTPSLHSALSMMGTLREATDVSSCYGEALSTHSAAMLQHQQHPPMNKCEFPHKQFD
jgi:hypothetical protein